MNEIMYGELGRVPLIDLRHSRIVKYRVFFFKYKTNSSDKSYGYSTI